MSVCPLDLSVYEASKIRIKKMINSNDHICVTFTGGKDSTVVLYLVDGCMKELGRSDKVDVLFRDEEFMPNDTLKFVKYLIDTGKYNFYYFCLPTLAKTNFLGIEKKYIQWDVNKNHKRVPPEYAITVKDVGNVLLKEGMFDTFKLYLNYVGGSVCIFNGYRTEESFNVYRSIINNPNNCYLNKSKISDRITICKPIYDWSVDDVFLYFLKNKLPYNKVYDFFMWCGLPLRSSIPLDKNAVKGLEKYKVYDPDYFNLLIESFPELDASSRYNKDISIFELGKKYGNDFKGVIKFISEHYDGKQKYDLLKDMKSIYHEKRKFTNKSNILGYYPIYNIYNSLIRGNVFDKTFDYTLDMFLFEGYDESDYLKWRELEK